MRCSKIRLIKVQQLLLTQLCIESNTRDVFFEVRALKLDMTCNSVWFKIFLIIFFLAQ